MKRMGRWSVGQRLAVGFGAVLAVLAAFAVAALLWQQQGAEAQAAYAQRIAPRTEAALDLERDIYQVAISVRAHLVAPAPERAMRVLADVEEARKSLRVLATFPKDPDGARLFDGLAPEVERYLSEVDAAARTAALANREAVEAALSQTRMATLERVQAYSGLQRDKARQAIAAMEASRERVARGLLFTFITVAAALAALGLVTAAAIREPARELTRIAREMQRGNWTPALRFAPAQVAARGETPSPRNELAQIALAFGAAAQALERREARLRADSLVAQAAASSLDKRAIAAEALRAMTDAIGATVGVVYWREPGSDELRPIAARGLAEEPAMLRVGEGLPGQAAAEGRLVLVGGIPSDTPMRVQLGIESLAPRAVAAVPLMLRGEAIGVVVLASLHEFDAEARAFLEAAALQLGVGLQNARSHDEVQRLVADLREAHEQVQAQNEELQAQNEEIQAQSEELQAQGEELQAQGEELLAQNDELQQRAAELAQADERKNEFLGLLAHELRNPLAAIGNSVFLVGRADSNAEQRRRGLEVIRRQMRYLTRLIDDLLDVTRITRGKLHLQREALDFAEVVRDGVNDCRQAAENAGLQMHASLPDGPVYVHGDRTRLAQVIGNLVGNAIKFTPRGGRVEVAVRVHPESGELSFSVRDTGVGIEPALAQRLFQPFSQGETELARDKGGLGLGLALSKALVELHGGRIEIRSAGRDAGTEMLVTLPLGEARPAAGESAPSAPSREPRRILLIEDNEDGAEMLRMALESEGHAVDIAMGGIEGVDRARATLPDFVLCDIGIPGIDGFEVARRLRADPRLEGTSLVAISGYATAEDRRRSAAAGFDVHLAKPVSMDVLLEVIAARARGRSADVTA